MKRFQNILVTVDTRFSEQPALRLGIQLARHNGSRLKIVDVVPELSLLARSLVADSDEMHKALAEEKRRALLEIAESLRQEGLDVTTDVLFGATSVQVIQEVLKGHHDLVVRVTKGTQSQGIGFFGTTSKRLLRKCPCALWLVRPDVASRFGRILAAVDPVSSDPSQARLDTTVMELGRSVAAYDDGELHIVHSWNLFGAGVMRSRLKPGEFEEFERKGEAEVTAICNRFLEPWEITCEADNVHVVRDEAGAGHAVSELAEQLETDLVVMGTIARTGIKGLLIGSTAERVLDQVRCSVLTIKPDEFISPITRADA